jgi:uncharacterized protein (TIGR02646 family)
MIRINKSLNIPAILQTNGVTATLNLINDFNASPASFKSAPGLSNKIVRKMEFDAAIYAHQSVKEQLIIEQHDKCCFCEGSFSDNSYGDVEHFRPKKAYIKRGQRKLTYPGYYWLAYDWKNLIYSCEKCNRSFKRNHFPVVREITRVKYHDDVNTITDEERLLIDPILESADNFFYFNQEVPISRNIKGQLSIDIFGLERLNDSRLEHLTNIKLALTFTNINENDAAAVNAAAAALGVMPAQLKESIIMAKKLFNSVAKVNSKFSYCVRCNFPTLPTV